MLNILINRSEIAAGTRGSSLGPDAIKFESLNNNSNLFIENKIVEIPIDNSALIKNEEFQNANNINSLTKNLLIANDCTIENTDKNANIIFVSADHSMAIAHVNGVKKLVDDKKLGVLWIDAHADLHTPFTSPSGNIHGMPLSVLLNEDNIENKDNSPTEKVVNYWENLKKKFHSIKYSDLFYVGLRAVEKQELKLIKKNNIPLINVRNINNGLIEDSVKQIESFFKNHDYIYISFDIDVLDPDDTSYGTGTPEKYGILKDRCIEFFDFLLNIKKIKFFELVEVNPLLDTENKLAKVSLEILELIKGKFQDR